MAERPGGRPPLRVGGFVLLGIGVAAAIAGLFTAATRGDPSGPLPILKFSS